MDTLTFRSQRRSLLRTYARMSEGMSEAVSTWQLWLDPFLPNIERCRGFDSLHAILLVMVVFLCSMRLRDQLSLIDAAEERGEC